MEVMLLGADDGWRLETVAPDVFDNPLDPELTAQFLADPRHHMVVAIEGGAIVGFASGVHYIHPDKPPELFINEVGVAPGHQRRGAGKGVLARLLDHGRALGCVNAWVLTDAGNAAAIALYAGAGGAATLGGGPDAGALTGFEFALA